MGVRVGKGLLGRAKEIRTAADKETDGAVEPMFLLRVPSAGLCDRGTTMDGRTLMSVDGVRSGGSVSASGHGAADERARVASVRMTGLLDTERELEFDQVVELAASICGTPIAAFTLVAETRQWFKAAVGLGMREMSRKVSFCSRAIEQADLFVVEDARRDARVSDLVSQTDEPGIRFYAGMPLAGPDGQMLGTLCVADVTPRQLSDSQKTALQILAAQLRSRIELRLERRKLETALTTRETLVRALRASDDRFRTFMHHSPFLSYIKDSRGRFMFYNRRFAEEFRIDAGAWLGRTVHETFSEDLAVMYSRNDADALEGEGIVEREEETRDEQGGATQWRSYKFRFENERGEKLLGGFAIDITEEVLRRRSLETTNAALERYATVDVLTGLVNRRVLDQELRREFVQARQNEQELSVVMLDVDNFKQLNDTFGHAAGDAVLERLGQLLRETVRSADVAGRFGGEELMVVLPRTDARGAMLLARRVRRAMASEQWPNGAVTASFGVATLDATMVTAEPLIRRADDAMYEAKRAGKDRIVAYRQTRGARATEEVA